VRPHLDGISTVSRCIVIPLYHSMPLSSSGIHSSPSSCSAEFQARACASRVSGSTDSVRGLADSSNGRKLGAVRVNDSAVLPAFSVPWQLPPLAAFRALMPHVQEKLV